MDFRKFSNLNEFILVAIQPLDEMDTQTLLFPEKSLFLQ
jgi:hypothetical protein